MSGNEQITGQRNPFMAAVEAGLRTRCGVEKGWRLLVAVSGGADSVALLLALLGLGGRAHWELDLHVGHVNHHLRDDADEDARFVRGLAERLGVAFHGCDIRPGEVNGNLEGNARRMRYEALAEIAGKVDADAVVTAHHADDQLETMLMRLVRGSSAGGLGGIAPRRRLNGRLVIRPMLGVDHAMAEEFCRAMKQEWREDHTNRSVERWRSRLRAEVLPVLRELRADAAMKADDTAQQVRVAAAIVEAHAWRFIARHVRELTGGEAVMQREAARGMTGVILGAILRRLLITKGVCADQLPGRVIGQIVAAARDKSGEERRFDLAGGVRVHIDGSSVRVTCGGS